MKMENCGRQSNAQSAISVIIPVFNGAEYIGGAIRSCLRQIEPLDEIIVVNDGSFDGTAGVLHKFVLHPQVKVLRQTNQGVSSARNAGVRVSTRGFVAFLDA